ncbi:MAG TPA: Bax inhibitor-1/YccA family protein, partial [Sporichthya sp.]|nr:Bax inhibitor-1/YccA family protein [Sporichthya sp.]
MQSTNPVLSRQDVFNRNGYATFRTDPKPSVPDGLNPVQAPPVAGSRPMTLDDVIARTGLLLVIAIGTGTAAWLADVGYGLAVVAMLVGFGLAMVNIFKKSVSPALVMAYAAVEGVALGAISHAIESSDPSLEGVAVQAVAGTAVVFGVMLALYKSGKVRVTPRFTRVLMASAIAYLIVMFGNALLQMFNSGFNAWGGGLGLLTAALGVTIGAFFLALDFDSAEKLIGMGVPERESWRVAFGLMVTIVWIYMEMLR